MTTGSSSHGVVIRRRQLSTSVAAHCNVTNAHCHDLRVRANVIATPAVKPNSKLHKGMLLACGLPVFSAIVCSSPVMHCRSCCIAANADAVALERGTLFGDQNEGALPASDGRREPSVLEGWLPLATRPYARWGAGEAAEVMPLDFSALCTPDERSGAHSMDTSSAGVRSSWLRARNCPEFSRAGSSISPCSSHIASPSWVLPGALRTADSHQRVCR